MLHQFSEESPEKTLAMFQAVIPRIKDGQSREIVERTAEKFMLLSEKSCVELTETTRRRFRQENERSIRTRLAIAKEKSENQYGSQQPSEDTKYLTYGCGIRQCYVRYKHAFIEEKKESNQALPPTARSRLPLL